ncbi:hypothetical protein BCV70DRAFT_94636 [Testicularia cyperi]|uniref:Uncharacterized protein n=1 Tax=Testicularia cyperi TaxID=1882483 RepID=A0A317XQ07_9BASI|nr:hypothetical protein BCV70DRAFT_94636 [Testicularia cyperi]
MRRSQRANRSGGGHSLSFFFICSARVPTHSVPCKGVAYGPSLLRCCYHLDIGFESADLGYTEVPTHLIEAGFTVPFSPNTSLLAAARLKVQTAGVWESEGIRVDMYREGKMQGHEKDK